jgi:hypothetical protein
MQGFREAKIRGAGTLQEMVQKESRILQESSPGKPGGGPGNYGHAKFDRRARFARMQLEVGPVT